MKKIILHTMIALLTFGGGVVAYAKDDGVVTPNSFIQKVRNLFQDKREIKQETRDAVKTIRQETKDEIKQVREEVASSTDRKLEIKELKEKMASSTKEIKNRLASSTKAIKEKVEEARKEMQEQQKAQIEKRAENHFDKMTARYLATIEREETIMAKVNSRIEKIKTGGGNTNAADRLVAEAKIHLTEARVSLDSLKVIVDSVSTTEGAASTTATFSKDTLTTLKKANKEIEKHLQMAHKALEKAVGSLRGLSQLNNATSTKKSD